ASAAPARISARVRGSRLAKRIFETRSSGSAVNTLSRFSRLAPTFRLHTARTSTRTNNSNSQRAPARDALGGEKRESVMHSTCNRQPHSRPEQEWGFASVLCGVDYRAAAAENTLMSSSTLVCITPIPLLSSRYQLAGSRYTIPPLPPALVALTGASSISSAA